jgi:hypothetical protein
MRMPSIDRLFSKASLRTMTLPLVFATLLAGCETPSKLSSLDVPLVFRPENATPGHYGQVPASPGLKLSLPPVADERDVKDRIGQNTELAGKEPRPILATSVTPAEYMHSVLMQELTTAGYGPVPDGSGANRVLSVRLKRFFTTEANKYDCEVVVAAEVRDQSGAVLWKGDARGASENWGRSMSPKNYQGCFTDAAIDVVADLLGNKQFQAAMSVK